MGEEHRAHVAAWWVEVFGGPTTYTDEHGGYESMLAHHRGLGITSEQRFRFASLMSLAADDAELPADPEFRAAIRGYIDWAVPTVALSHPDDTDIPSGLTVPRWSWDGLQRSSQG